MKPLSTVWLAQNCSFWWGLVENIGERAADLRIVWEFAKFELHFSFQSKGLAS